MVFYTGLCIASMLSGCGQESKQQETKINQAASETQENVGTETEKLDTIVPGKLTVVTSPDYAPHEFYAIAEDGTPTLADFDLALASILPTTPGLPWILLR